MKQENTILQNESKSLKFELRKVVEIRHQEKIQTDLKLKDLEKRFKRMIENKQLTRPNPNHISQSQNTSHKENFLRNRSDENLPQSIFFNNNNNNIMFDRIESRNL